MPRNAQLLEVGGIKIKSKSHVPLVPPSHKHQWIRLADPHRSEIHLCQESKFVLAWLSQCFTHEQPRAVAVHSLIPTAWALGAGSALPLLSSGSVKSSPQSNCKRNFNCKTRYSHTLAVSRTWAQLALAQCSWQCLRSKHVRFCVALRIRQHQR